MTERVLVTGAAGFIGGHLCKALLDCGHPVVGVDSFDPYYDRARKERNVAQLRPRADFSLIESDVRRLQSWRAEAEAADVVVHLAARPGVRVSFTDPVGTVDANVGGTAAVLEGCRQAGVSRLVVGSSSSVYGDIAGAACEGQIPRPLSPYGVSKRAAEMLAEAYARSCGVRVALLRLFSVYGPRQRPDQAFSRFARAMTAGAPIERFGDGASERDYTHVTDVVQGVLGAIRWTGGAEPRADIFNIGTGRPVPLADAVRLLEEGFGVHAGVRALPAQQGDPRRTHANIEKARAELAYEPSVRLEDGIADFVSWYEVAYGREPRTTA